jgi:deoxyribodipyrimidine photo-lyase
VSRSVLWFRRDLRIDDLPALAAAAGADRVVPLFVVDPALLTQVGPNRRRFLAASLRALDEELDGNLVLRRGDPRQVVPAFAAEVGARTVSVTEDFGPYGASRDRDIASALSDRGATLQAVDSAYAVAPGTLYSAAGAPFRVFGAYRRAWEAAGWGAPEPPSDARYAALASDVSFAEIEQDVAPSGAGLPAWWEGLPLGAATSPPPPAGAAASRERLDRFIAGPLALYDAQRNIPAVAGTSGLSPYLHFGSIHPRSILARVSDAAEAGAGARAGAARLRDELAWRDFYADVLSHRPESVREPLQPFAAHLRWDSDDRARERFRAWAVGRTGYPLVDAGMRQLLAEGWMHNRVRMVTASFLVKDLHIDWRLGARWFMWHLLDGDLASNQHGWQWVVGSGTDAAPFHRVLNPSLQQERFDPDGVYVRRYIEDPSPVGPPGSLFAADDDYPEPLVDHAEERRDTLGRFDEARRAAAEFLVRPNEAPRRAGGSP